MVQFNFLYDPNVTLEQRIGFEMAAAMWSTFLTDDITVNLRIGATTGLDNDQAVGGAIPIFHEQNYGVYQEYLAQDATSADDATVVNSLQAGNTTDVLVNGELVDGNTSIMLTSAQAKALGMDEALVLDDGTVWDRDLVDSTALDGYIVLNESYDWNYDFARSAEAPEGTLDFLTMALHEIGHSLGFVSGIDGLLDTFTMHSGETRTEGMTALDLLRYSEVSAALENPDGAVADLSEGTDSYFSLDGGDTALADFSTGQAGDGYQASHWQRFQQALGIMDPTLGYQERTDISHLDLQAFDVLGWDVDYTALSNGLDFEALLAQAQQTVAADFGVEASVVQTAFDNGQDWYTLGYGGWWQAFEAQMLELGYGGWWQQFEADLLAEGYPNWWQAFDAQMVELGYGGWWQAFEEKVLELGYGGWWQEFESSMLDLGYGGWWQAFEPAMLELTYGGWWQQFEAQMVALGYGGWWQEFENSLLELGYGGWWQAFEERALELGYGGWWQIFEETVLELGYGGWWQEFESNLLELGYGGWWQVFELGYGGWWQQIEQHINTLNPPEEPPTLDNSNGSQDVISGGNADDILAGGLGQDLISGAAGDDLLDGKEGNDLLLGDAGNDIVYGWDGEDILFGGEGDDLLAGENDNDQVYGEAGHDILFGGRGDDQLYGGEGRDVLKGDTGNDVLDGGSGDDQLSGNTGDDLLIGGEGQDKVVGGNDNDVLYGDGYFVPVVVANTPNPAISQPADSPKKISAADALVNLDIWMRLEAEDMQLIKYSPDDQAEASGGNVIAIHGNGNGNGNRNGNGNGRARTTFSGPSGTYDLIVGYYDDAGGTSEITLVIKGQGTNTEYTFQLDGSTGAGTYQISGVTLESGNKIELQGSADGTDLARLDYLDILTAGTTATFDDAGNPTGNFYQFVGAAQEVLKLEVEQMDLSSGGSIAYDSSASGTGYVQTGSSENFSATTLFSGETGYYDVVVGYYDTHNGAAEIVVNIDNNELGRWFADQDLGTSAVNTQSFTQYTVAEAVQISNLDLIQISAFQDGGDQANLDYIQFIEVEAPVVSLPDPLRVEAEDMALSGDYSFEDRDFASGTRLIKTSSSLTATTEFTGPAGLYNIVIGYYDENDGNSPVTVSLDGTQLDSWTFDQDLGNAVAGADNFVTRTVASAVALEAGAVLELQASHESSEFARIDYVEFVAIEAPTHSNPVVGDPVDPTTSPDLSGLQTGEHSDILQGGAGNDTAYGGAGNDFIYGDSGDDILYGDFARETWVNQTPGTLSPSNDLPTGGYTNEANGHYYLRYNTMADWATAQAYAESLGGNLVTINDAAEEQWLQTTFGTTDQFWTGLTDRAVEGTFEWVSGEAVTYTNWVSGEPNNAGGTGDADYARMNYTDSLQWGDYGGDSLLYSIIEINQSVTETSLASPPPAMQFDGDDAIIVNHSNEMLLNNGTLSFSFEADSVSAFQGLLSKDSMNYDTGGHFTIYLNNDELIARFQSTDRNYVVQTDVSSGQAYDVAITFGDRGLELWLDGTLVDTNSYTGGLGTTSGGSGNYEPIVLGANQWASGDQTADVVEDYFTGTLQNVRLYDQQLNGTEIAQLPISPNTSANVVFAEIVTVSENTANLPDGERYNGSLYLLTDSAMLWTEAQAYAKSLGGNLVTINDAAEDEWLKQTFGTTEALWIGFSDAETEGTWKWASGEESEWVLNGTNTSGMYVNWSPGQPDSYNGTEQDYAVLSHIWLSDRDDWDDADSGASHRGIIEIKLPPESLGEAGNDILTGGSGNDSLYGEAGNDSLNGTDQVAAGFYEQDTLYGGAGADTFILGDGNQAYYSLGGLADFAVIKDFATGVDTLQLHGTADNYQQQWVDSSLHLHYGPNLDLIARFENLGSLLNLNTDVNFAA